MNIIELKERQNSTSDINVSRLYTQLGELLKELNKKELPHAIIEAVNQDIEELNARALTNNELRKLVKQKQTGIIKRIEKELKIVPKNYYRNLWLVVGMSVFGLPIGVAIGLNTGNMGFLAIGLPIGMAIGIATGSAMDNKASKEGRQLDIEIKY